MKIYFAGSIRGGRADKDVYLKLIEYLRRYGEVLTEHVGDAAITESGGEDASDEEIYEKDMAWLREADALIAEVSTPSLGVGFEIGMAQSLGKKVLCLFNPDCGRKISAMLSGNPSIKVGFYQTLSVAQSLIDKFFNDIKENKET